MTLMQRIEEVRMIQEQEKNSKCDFCGKNHTSGAIEDRNLFHFYSVGDFLIPTDGDAIQARARMIGLDSSFVQ